MATVAKVVKTLYDPPDAPLAVTLYTVALVAAEGVPDILQMVVPESAIDRPVGKAGVIKQVETLIAPALVKS